uniref:Uncharacterized protein n=1 Tax=Halimeda minima TaxID=170427 RepID=A0A386AYX6_9CHLO|nr:hypothetical protein [Halimeda minima]
MWQRTLSVTSVKQVLATAAIPVLLYARTFGIWFISVFLVFKLVSLGAEIYQLLAASGIAKNVPPSVVAKAQELAELVGGTAAEAPYGSPSLFLAQFLKAISFLVLGLLMPRLLLPAPELSPELSPKLGQLFKLSAIAGVYGLILCDTRYISQLAASVLQASPSFTV